MRPVTGWLRRILTAMRFSEAERAMDDEMRFHLDMETADLQRAGVSSEEARRKALVAFGGLERFKEEARDHRQFLFAEHLIRDTRLAIRQLRRSRGVAMSSAALFAIGIGGTTVVFSVINTLYFRPLPYPDANRLVRVQTVMNDLTCGTRCARSPSGREVDAMVHQAKSIDAIGTIRIMAATFHSSDGAMALEGAAVSRDLISMLRPQPMLGRSFTVKDYESDAPAVVMLSQSAWQREFSGDSTVVGRAISLDDTPYIVVGVTNADAELGPPLFTFNARRAQFLSPERTRVIDATYSTVIARIRNDHALPAVRAELDKLFAAVSNDAPISMVVDWRSSVTPIREVFIERYRASFWHLLGASVAVLLVTGLNVFGLYAARLHDRRQELATRVALGASRFRIAQQIAIETSVIAIAGGVGGILIGYVGTSMMNLLPIDSLPFWTRLQVDIRGVALAAFLTLSMSVLLGGAALAVLAPQQLLTAWRIGDAGGKHAARMRQTLIASQIALTVILLSVAGVLGNVVLKAELKDIGTAKHGLMYVLFQTPDALSVDATIALNHRLSDRLLSIPGVTAAGVQGSRSVINSLDTATRERRSVRAMTEQLPGIVVEGEESVAVRSTVRLSSVNVSTQYFSAMGTPVLQGRAFTETDNIGAPAVAIVDEPTARNLVSNGTIIGKRIGMLKSQGERTWMTVVGVVSQVIGNPLEQDAPFVFRVFRPLTQVPSTPSSAVIRVPAGSYPSDNSVRAAIREADAGLAIANILSVEESIGLRLSQARVNASMLVGSAIYATMLCGLGIYAAVTFVVVSRKREIAIRMALGAVHSEVVRLFMIGAARMVCVGLIIGLLGAIASARLIKSMLYGADAINIGTLGIALGFMLACAILAAWIPSRRSTRMEPARLLRSA